MGPDAVTAKLTVSPRHALAVKMRGVVRPPPVPNLDAQTLVRAVATLATPQEPVVKSAALKTWFNANGYDWGEHNKGWKGHLFDAADDEATDDGKLVKWKRQGAQNAPVGWSLADDDAVARATAWAKLNGWRRVTLGRA